MHCLARIERSAPVCLIAGIVEERLDDFRIADRRPWQRLYIGSPIDGTTARVESCPLLSASSPGQGHNRMYERDRRTHRPATRSLPVQARHWPWWRNEMLLTLLRRRRDGKPYFGRVSLRLAAT